MNRDLDELKFRKFHDLMRHRVREILLVSTSYDAFILEEDGRLTERLFLEYSELNLSSAPRVTHVKTGHAALAALAERRFDLVLATLRVPDMDVFELGRRVKESRPGRPVVLLAMDDGELRRLPPVGEDGGIDKVFLWTGDAKILLAIIKYVEDRENAAADLAAGVLAILVVEDSVRYYSVFLGMLYAELMLQSQSLIAEGLNDLHRLMRMRARPKILLATTYEEAVKLYRLHRAGILAIISDVAYPRDGKMEDRAGFEFLAEIREDNRTLPVVLHSADAENQAPALRLGAKFLNKNDPSLLYAIRAFLRTELGFGDFVFRLPDGTEVARARDLFEMEQKLGSVPAESLEYHARNNHVSVWLAARCEFDLAQKLQPRTVDDFGGIEGVRAHLIESLRATRIETRRGAVEDFSAERFDPRSTFVRMGQGSLGGKARGLGFMNALLARRRAARMFPGLAIQIPPAIVVATDSFDRFLEENRLHETAYGSRDDERIAREFLAARLPERVRANLARILDFLPHPLAVRSSSLLEDSQFRPFAGIYATVMLPNNDPDPAVRLEELVRAVKRVYASTFLANARSYMEATPNRIEEEKMGVVIQQLVGRRHGDRFYPDFSGLAQSYNYYPIGPQKADDGIAQVALGLGKLVVEGGLALRFCPRHPQVMPQFGSPQAVFRNSQRVFYALDLARTRAALDEGTGATVREYGLDAAETDGTLGLVAGTYSPDDDRIVDSLAERGPRVVTFANVLKHGALPLAPALDYLLGEARAGIGLPVEIEFAVDMGDQGRPPSRWEEPKPPTLYFLQMRPMISRTMDVGAKVDAIPRERRVCYSGRSMGFGRIDTVRDVLYVRRETFDTARTREIAREVGRLNEALARTRTPCLLIGPGRWGSSDPSLGIPVQWSQISTARVIVEASPEWYQVDPSQGTHFFQNITSLRVGYLTVLPHAAPENGQERDFLDWDWLDRQPSVEETEHLRHVRLAAPLVVHLDGQTGQGVIARPEGDGE